jgi:hypothetical protein
MSAFQPAEVEARMSPDGSTTPISFSWEGRQLRVAEIGRAWRDDDGDHWLVMPTFPVQPFEILRTPSGEWQVSKPGGTRTVI